MSDEYEVIPARQWVNKRTGATCSIYGVKPDEDPGWHMEQCGWTVRNPHTGQVGIGRLPWAEKADAIAWAAKNKPSRIGLGD